MILRLVVLFALASVLLIAKEQPLPDCCAPESDKLSQLQVKALIHKTEPIYAPCCADMLHISGTIVLEISVDSKGDVTCVQVVSGLRFWGSKEKFLRESCTPLSGQRAPCEIQSDLGSREYLFVQSLVRRRVGSDLRTCHRFWSDYGQAGSNPKVRFADNSEAVRLPIWSKMTTEGTSARCFVFSYSCRRACMGSTCVARRAGK